MLNPLRSEEDAFRMVIIVAILAAPVILAALVFGSGVALGVIGGLAFAGFLLAIKNRREPEPERVSLGPAGSEGRRGLLVVANETLSGRALREEVEYRANDGREVADVYVVCPALNTRVRHWTNEEEPAREQAAQRLEVMLTALRGRGVEASGDIGDDDPVQAMEDALRTFPADQAIISTHPLGRSNWLETDVVVRARDRFTLPISHVVVDLDREREAVGG